jgi:hypothetical protein
MNISSSVSAPSIISAAKRRFISKRNNSINTNGVGVNMSYKGFTEEETKFLIKIGQINKPIGSSQEGCC